MAVGAIDWGSSAKRGGRRCVRGWGDVSRWISAVKGKDWGIVPHRSDLIREKIRVMFRVGSAQLRGRIGESFRIGVT